MVALVFMAFNIVPLLGLLFRPLAILSAIAAILLGHLGFSASRRVGVGRKLAIAGLVTGYIAAAALVWYLVSWAVGVTTAFG